MDLTKRRRRLNGNEPDVDKKRLSCRLERRVSLFPFPREASGRSSLYRSREQKRAQGTAWCERTTGKRALRC